MNIVKLKGQAQKGFTLIELMITVAIVGILAAIALPAYQDYVVRAQVSEAVVLTGGAKVASTEFYANSGAFPADNAAAGFGGAAGKYTSSVEIATNTIVSSFGGAANSALTGKSITLTGTADSASGVITWACSSTADAKYLTKSCN